ncbi:helix-turn-helix domain-containing protein [Chachezhania sediminis]|uniref:helix-turn-helix domain-containing protein n=1 Tax=Chachezhania sediminis TaxID=2599291 RepID=UPI003898F456
MRETFQVFQQEGENASRASEARRVHRNTMKRQLAQAQDLLRRGSSRNRTEVAAALGVLRWLPGPE